MSRAEVPSVHVTVLALLAGCLLLGGTAGAASTAAASALTASTASGSVAAPVTLVDVSGAWVRQAVKGQSGTGGFMQLTSARPLTLVGFTTPVAATAELHEMSMEGDVMRMRAIDSLPLPAGQKVALQPGGHHLMLTGLKQALKVGEAVPLTLILRMPDGRTVQQDIVVPVRASAPQTGGHSADHGMSHQH
ncbi:MAG: copper chaperone PCu(A)C [Burkholderiales bacterium]|nr:copper chaperone PCu(A)C [Burkholderiales bacterium]